jgi:tetraprenyl-beta-curcumene synthase
LGLLETGARGLQHPNMRSKRAASAREIAALLGAGLAYWLTIYPRARLEIRRCRTRAQAIGDPTLREQALAKLTSERLNPEAAAFFAVLAPRRHRRELVRLMVDFQVAYDYLDAINEQPETASLRNGLQLHRALRDAVSLDPAGDGYYLHHPQHDDGGYLAGLVLACQAIVRGLPSARAIEPVLVRAATRCGEAQSRNHAVLVEGDEQLIEWTRTQPDGGRYLWWELAAAGISCLVIHALFAAAACTTTLEEAWRIDAAYFPPVCAISALLDSLIDWPHDDACTNHSFVGHYRSRALAARRLGAIASEARALSSRLSNRARHAVILAGIASFYLSAPEARSRLARPAAARTLDCLGATTKPMLAVMRWRRSSRE